MYPLTVELKPIHNAIIISALVGFTAGLAFNITMMRHIVDAKNQEMMQAVMQVASAPVELLPPPVGYKGE